MRAIVYSARQDWPPARHEQLFLVLRAHGKQSTGEQVIAWHDMPCSMLHSLPVHAAPRPRFTSHRDAELQKKPGAQSSWNGPELQPASARPNGSQYPPSEHNVPATQSSS